MSNCFNCDKPIEGVAVECKDCGKKLHEACAAQCIKCGAALCDTCALNKGFKCDECIGEIDGGVELEQVRRSHIDDYEECPHGFYLTVVKGVTSPGNAYSEVGVELHEIFDRNSQRGDSERISGDEGKNRLLQEWSEVFSRIEHEKFVGCQTRLTVEGFKKKMFEQGVTNIENYVKWEATRPAPWRTEEQIVEYIDNDTSLPKVSITMDRIDYINGEYEVIDYKTGKVFVGKKLSTYLQTPLYIIMIEKHYGIKVSRFRYLFFNEDKERVFERVDDDTFVCTVAKREYTVSLQECIKRVKRDFSKIKRGQFQITPNVSKWKCAHMCSHMKTGHCAGIETQSWINKNNMV